MKTRRIDIYKRNKDFKFKDLREELSSERLSEEEIQFLIDNFLNDDSDCLELIGEQPNEDYYNLENLEDIDDDYYYDDDIDDEEFVYDDDDYYYDDVDDEDEDDYDDIDDEEFTYNDDDDDDIEDNEELMDDEDDETIESQINTYESLEFESICNTLLKNKVTYIIPIRRSESVKSIMNRMNDLKINIESMYLTTNSFIFESFFSNIELDCAYEKSRDLIKDLFTISFLSINGMKKGIINKFTNIIKIDSLRKDKKGYIIKTNLGFKIKAN